MEHIGYKVFYKAQFELHTTTEIADVDMLWELICCVRFWLTKKYRRLEDPLPEDLPIWTGWKNGTKIYSRSRRVILDSCSYQSDDAHLYWAGKIIEQPSSVIGFAPREWLTEIGFQQEQPGVSKISLITAYLDRPGFIGPCQPEPSYNTPGIIHHLRHCKGIRCMVSGRELTDQPICLKPGQFKEFWEVVSDPARTVPVVYISPRWEDEKVTLLLDPEKTAKILDMNALVYYADSLDFSEEMRQVCPDPERFGCYGGCIRIYASLPHIDYPNDARRHRQLTVNQLRELTFQNDQGVYSVLRRALVQDIHFYNHLFSVEKCRSQKDQMESSQHLDSLRQALSQTQAEIRDINTSLDKTQLSLDETESSNQQLEKRLEEQKDLTIKLKSELENTKKLNDAEQKLIAEIHDEEIKRLNEELQDVKRLADAYMESASQSEQMRRALQELQKSQPYPKTAEQVANYFFLHFPDKIDFTDRARKSLKDCQTRPDILWGALDALVTLYYDLNMDDTCSNIEAAFNAKCSNYEFKRGQGTATRNDKSLMRQYFDTYQGRSINVEPHLASNINKESDSRFLRIYLCFDQQSGKIIISYCGKHLNNASTRKIH